MVGVNCYKEVLFGVSDLWRKEEKLKPCTGTTVTAYFSSSTFMPQTACALVLRCKPSVVSANSLPNMSSASSEGVGNAVVAGEELVVTVTGNENNREVQESAVLEGLGVATAHGESGLSGVRLPRSLKFICCCKLSCEVMVFRELRLSGGGAAARRVDVEV